MNNKLDAKIYLWNSLCEKLCFEKLSLKSIKATDSNLEDLKTLTIIYSHSISKSFKILTIYSELAELQQANTLEEDLLQAKLEQINNLHSEIQQLLKNSNFAELRRFYLPKTENDNLVI